MSKAIVDPGHIAQPLATSRIENTGIKDLSKQREKIGKAVVERNRTAIPNSSSATAGRTDRVSTTASQSSGVPVESAAQQVSAAELTDAVADAALAAPTIKKKGASKFLKTITQAEDELNDLYIYALLGNHSDNSHPKPLVDQAFSEESLEDRAFIKSKMIEAALEDPEKYNLTPGLHESLMSEHANLMEKHGEYIEAKTVSIKLAQASAPNLRFGVKQYVKALSFLQFKEVLSAKDIIGFLKIILANPRVDKKVLLLRMRKQWTIVINKENVNSSSKINSGRLYILNQMVHHISMIIKSVEMISRIGLLCRKAGKANERSEGGLPDPFSVLLALVESLKESTPVTARSIKSLFEQMTEPQVQIYCSNLKVFVYKGLLFRNRFSEKVFYQTIMVLNEVLRESYHRVKT